MDWEALIKPHLKWMAQQKIMRQPFFANRTDIFNVMRSMQYARAQLTKCEFKK